MVGQPAERLFEGIHAEDRQVRKAAKAATRKANAHFTDLCGVFVLGVGPRGLTVTALPQRPAGSLRDRRTGALD